MALFADAIRPSVPGEFFQLTASQTQTLADGIAGGSYALGADSSNVVLDFRDRAAAVALLASDASRLATAGVESAMAANDPTSGPGALAWRLVKLYYAAFYCGHAMSRLLGHSGSYLGAASSNRLVNLAALYKVHPPYKITPGIYGCVLDGATLKLCKAPDSRGSHELFWQSFSELLQSLSSDVLRGPLPRQDAQVVSMRLGELRDVLRRRSLAGSWLSTMRNEVQYRHAHDVWFPVRLPKRDRDDILRRCSSWDTDPLKMTAPPRSDIGAFVWGCTTAVAMCHDLTQHILSRAGAKSFLRSGPGRILGLRTQPR